MVVDPDEGPAQGRDPDVDRGQAPASASPPELSLPAGAQAARAQSLLVVRRYAESATLFESLWRELSPHDPRFLYHAALARTSAGQHGLAAENLRLFLTYSASLQDPLRAEIVRLLESECRRATPVQIRLSETLRGSTRAPPQPSQAQATLVLETDSRVPGGDRLRREYTHPTAKSICLDPGAYDLTLRMPGYQPLHLRRTIAAQAEHLSWDLSVEPVQVVVDLKLTPDKALRRARRGSLKITPSDRPDGEVILREGIEPMMTMVLTPGAWRVEIETPKYKADRTISVVPGSRSVDILLVKRSVDLPRFARRKKAALPIVGYFIATYFGGIGLILGGSARERNIKAEYENFLADAGFDPEVDAEPDAATIEAAQAAIPTADYHRKLRRMAGLQTAGVTVAMHGVALTVASLPMAVGGKKRASYIILGVGGAVLAGGAGWMANYAARTDTLLSPTDPSLRVTDSQMSSLTGHRLGAGMLTGVGSGMVLGSVAILLLDRRHRRRYSAAPWTGPGLAGLSMRGRF